MVEVMSESMTISRARSGWVLSVQLPGYIPLDQFFP